MIRSGARTKRSEWGFQQANLVLQSGFIQLGGTLRVTGIPYHQYDVYVYLGAGDNKGTGSVTLASATAGVQRKRTRYYTLSWLDGRFVTSQADTLESAPQANVVLFPGESAREFQLEWAGNLADGWTGVTAAQIVQRPGDEAALYRIDTRDPAGLRELFRYDGHPLPVLSAHRGGAGPGWPENCLATFEHTLQHTFSLLEIDLQQTRDGQLVLRHDSNLDRTTTGSGPVGQRTLQELKQLHLKDSDGQVTRYRMPTLDEALHWARGKTVVILDKKDVPVEVCVQKIQQHQAQSYAMVMAYSFDDIRKCHELDPAIMMEVMIGTPERLAGFTKTGVPWDRVIAFIGHTPPQDKELVKQLHAQGVCCMAGTSRNLDPRLRHATDDELSALRQEYQARLGFGVDLLEVDLPVQVAQLLFTDADIPIAASKARFLRGR